MLRKNPQTNIAFWQRTPEHCHTEGSHFICRLGKIVSIVQRVSYASHKLQGIIACCWSSLWDFSALCLLYDLEYGAELWKENNLKINFKMRDLLHVTEVCVMQKKTVCITYHVPDISLNCWAKQSVFTFRRHNNSPKVAICLWRTHRFVTEFHYQSRHFCVKKGALKRAICKKRRIISRIKMLLLL